MRQREGGKADLVNVRESTFEECPHVVFGESLLVVQFSVNVAMVEESHVHVLHLHTEND